jgi:NAD(P)-dependent dehydrogenase (short-subunit alcohol dehydrogenase family)
MIAGGGGRIVNVASTAGVEGSPYVSAYTAAKHGVVGLTRALALETAPHGITVNAVCPGFADTDLLAESAKKVAEKTGRSINQVKAKYAESNSGGRLIDPQEVAQKVVWLCSPDRTSVTGEAIVIDGSEAE